MNYYDLPEYASLAPFDITPGSNSPAFESPSPSSLLRLVARVNRYAAAPSGYRFAANIAAAELERALIAVKHTSVAGEVRLITPAFDDAGHPVADVAVYVRDDLPDPAAFWSAFHSPVHSDAA